MTRRDAELDALIRSLGAAYYRALHGEGSAADVNKAETRVAEATREGGKPGSLPTAAEAPAKSGRSDRWEVGDVMTTKVVSVTGHAGYKQIAQLLHEHELTALPVLTPEGRVAGVVSEADLLRKEERQERTGWRPSWEMDPALRARTEALTATGLMTSPAVTIGPDALLGTAARLMNQRRIKRLPVVDREGKLIGIVSRADLLRVFLRPDAEIAAEASAVLTDILLADPRETRATARDGVVTLVGRLASQDRTEAAVRLTQAIDGVVAVTSKLTAPPSDNWPDAGDHGANRDLARDTAKRSLATSVSSSSSIAEVTAASA
jgi:CBS-domain-containing membrane protein